MGDTLTNDAALRIVTEATNEHCSCGGDGPETGCVACRVYHAIKARLDREFPAARGEGSGT